MSSSLVRRMRDCNVFHVKGLDVEDVTVLTQGGSSCLEVTVPRVCSMP